MTSPQSSRILYSDEQLAQYFAYVEFDEPRLVSDQLDGSGALPYLSKLVKHQLAKVPFENLDLHYSPHHAISLDPEYLFQKVVERKDGRGGYCMQNNRLFGTVLKSLGFKVFPVGARVSSAVSLTADNADAVDKATYNGFSHTVNIVTLGESRYFVDVGFGSRGPLAPVLLQDGVEGVSGGDSQNGVLHRLSREQIPENTSNNPEQLMWVYKIRFNEHMQWLPLYCFNETEFLPQDFEVMNYYVSRSLTSYFIQNLVCEKFILDRQSGEIVGEITLFQHDCKRRVRGAKQALATIKSESDRVEALKMHFGVNLTSPEIRGMTNRVPMIRGA